VTKRNVLEQLSKQRLIEIAQALEIHLGVNKPKADFVDAIVRDRRGVWPYAPTNNAVADVLNLLSRDELKAVCRGLGLDETGRSKQEIIDRMVEEDNAEDDIVDDDAGRRGAACCAQDQESETDDTGRRRGPPCPPSDLADEDKSDRRGVWPYAPTDQSGSDKSVCSNNTDTVTEFIQRWIKSESSERANKDAFIIELCDALGVGRPSPSTGNPKHDHYVFEAPVKIQGEESASVGRMDLYKKGCLILEAKQGSTTTSNKIGTARRGTPGWTMAMYEARGQALKYATHVDAPPPFLIVCDIGYCFDIFAAFDGTTQYHEFPTPQAFRIYFKDFEKHASLLRSIFTDPHGLDPSKQSIKVTRDVAAQLAALSKSLEADGHHPELVATFLMRCIFTMFAEDVGLLPDYLFTHMLKEYWLKNPASFPGGVSSLWKDMNNGDHNMIGGKLLQFNGGLFKDPQSPKLTPDQIQLLLNAAKHDWADVEPAIFGTLIERALDPKERHALGAHFTPKAYVERLVRPTIEEPLRADWDVVKAEARHLVEDGEDAKARAVIRKFHSDLCKIRVLDPACGSGNFLYVTMEIMKRIEGEVLSMLDGLGDTQFRLDIQHVTVNPSQFLGIEIKRWSKEIAEMVLWIGYLQWHLKAYGRGERKVPVPEPVLRDYKNIECRDAVLAYDKKEVVLDDKGIPVSRWDGETMKKSPVTGEDIPDDTARIPIYRYLNSRKSEWPKADFIVGNPPFIGKSRRRAALGDGYLESLNAAYPAIPDGVDYVMYWWHKASRLVRDFAVRRFGFITTNSITQALNRRVVAEAADPTTPFGVLFAIPDHPWVDSDSGASVRIAMTVFGDVTASVLRIARVTDEQKVVERDEVNVVFSTELTKTIQADLTGGAAVVDSKPLLANKTVCSVGVVLFGKGFVLSQEETDHIEPVVCFPFLTGRDIMQDSRGVSVIDMYPRDEMQARVDAPRAFQHLLERVKPARDHIRDPGSRERWWRFGRDKAELRAALHDIDRYIVVPEVSKHRVFIFLPSIFRPDHKLIVIALSDPFFLGVLSSGVHVVWSIAAGGRHGVGNDPYYSRSTCFDAFPFPACDEAQKQKVRVFGESLDAHRKARQAEYPDLTITGMYNVLEKLRAGEALNAKDKIIHEQGLVSVLKKIHDDLDDAVFEAYGWPRNLTDEEILERLVTLNHERAEEEKNGLVRWLRPEYQLKAVKGAAPEPEQQEFEATKTEQKKLPSVPAAAPPAEKQPWPKTLPERIVAIRDLVIGTKEAWSAEAVARSFVRGQVATAIPVLESLTAVGVLFEYTSGDVRTWRAKG
jgi:hypothetical protein